MTAQAEEQHQALVSNQPGINILRNLERAGAFTTTRLELPPDLSYDKYEAILTWLGSVKRATSWAIGDAIIYGEHTYGEKYAQAVEATGLSVGTLQNYVYVCSRVLPSRRVEGVHFSCHYEVAHMPPKAQRKWLARAKKEDLTQRQLRVLIREEEEALGEDNGRGEEIVLGSSDQGVGLPRSYVLDGALCRRLVRESQGEENGYVRVPRDLIARVADAIGLD
jgi:hypothetical protein